MAPRVLVVDKTQSTRDVIAELLGELAREVVWVAREGAALLARAAAAASRST